MARKRKPARRPTRAEAVASALLDVVVRLRIDGAQLHDLRAFANATGDEADKARGGPPWQLSDDDLGTLIGKADDLLVGRLERKDARAVALAVARREALYARAVNGADYSAALACLKDIATLQGIYPNVAEMRRLIKAQDDVIRELETSAARPALRSSEQSPPPAGEAEGDGDGHEAEAVEDTGGEPGGG